MSKKNEEEKVEEVKEAEVVDTKNSEGEEISYSRAIEAKRTISPVKQVQGQMVRQKSDLSSIKGKTGIHVYHIKHDIKDACKVLDDKHEDLVEDVQKIRTKIQELRESIPEDGDKKDLSKKDQKELDKLTKESEDLIDQINALAEETVTVTFKKGKLPISKIEDAVDSDTLEALDFAIDLNE